MKRRFLTVFPVLLMLSACSSGPKEVTGMAYTAEVCGESFTGTYSGTILDDLPNGAGTFTYEGSKETLSYTGQWENGVITGTGELEYDGYVLEYNDTEYSGVYSGEAENGFPSGEGTYEGEKRDKYLVYEGGWKDGAFSGEGYLEANEYIVFMADDVKRTGEFEGEVLDGIPCGEASFTTQNGAGVTYTHKGQWTDGKCNGYGIRKFEDEDYRVMEGNYNDGKYTPSTPEFFTYLGTKKSASFGPSAKAAQFLADYSQIFLTNSIEGTDLEIDKSFKFAEFTKNPSVYGDKLISVSMSVIQIWESSIEDISYTYCLGRAGNGNIYYMYMYNSAENILVNNWVKATILPLDYFTYETVSNTQQWAMAAAAVTITK